MSSLQETVLHNSGMDLDEDIEEIVFNTDRLIASLKSWKINKSDRIMLANAVNIIYLAR